VAGFAGLFLISAPVWWLFEAVNLRTRNWVYLGESQFASHVFAFWSTISITTVIPAVFESAELAASFEWVKRLRRGPRIGSEPRMILGFFVLGWIMLISLLCWPKIFFPLVWLSFYFLLEPINVWLGRRSLLEWTAKGDWRPVVALWLGVLITAFFWEMWNFFSYPKWIYVLPWGDWIHVFEMPLLGYGGYLPFALELCAFHHLLAGGRSRI